MAVVGSQVDNRPHDHGVQIHQMQTEISERATPRRHDARTRRNPEPEVLELMHPEGIELAALRVCTSP